MTVISIVRAPARGMAPVDPEEAPILEPKLSNPTDQPVGDSRNRLYPCMPFPLFKTSILNDVGSAGCTYNVVKAAWNSTSESTGTSSVNVRGNWILLSSSVAVIVS